MFSKKPHVDVKKSVQKVLDTKKDSPSRLKHLRLLLGEYVMWLFKQRLNPNYHITDYLDCTESKSFFDHHYSHVYYIFFDTLCSLEGNLKQKSK